MCDVVKDLAKEERAEEREEITFVIDKLFDAGRVDDARRAVKDENYLNQLIEEFKDK